MTVSRLDLESATLPGSITVHQPRRSGWPATSWRQRHNGHGAHRRSWEIHAQVAIDDVRGVAETAMARGGKSDLALKQSAFHQVNRQLAIAESYLKRPAAPWTWLRGTRLEGAWCHINSAKVALVQLLDHQQLRAHCPQILALADKYLKRGKPPKEEPALTAVKEWYGGLDSDPDGHAITTVRRHELANVLRESYVRVANEYHRLRRFQAAVIVTTLIVLLLVGTLVTVGLRTPQIIPLCFPDSTSPVVQASGAGTTACPTGPHGSPTSGDVGTVALFGLLGAALVGVRLVVRRAAPSTVPMATTRWFQALLKAATGMLTAILGLLFLRGGIVPGFTQVDTQSQILVYAIVFGASQELITRFVDQRSNDLLAAVTSSEAVRNDATDSQFES
ncbi:MAG TPA: hypothetical protein VFR23_25480 [Jiangellaceae bacterium]|nr:hypothetical protein [Jiangellaceae bacterium]